MKKFLTTENKQRICERAKGSAGDTFDYSEREAELAKDAEDERELAKELAAKMNDYGCCASVCANIIYIDGASGSFAVSVDKI